jgi:hypothetical protein
VCCAGHAKLDEILSHEETQQQCQTRYRGRQPCTKALLGAVLQRIAHCYTRYLTPDRKQKGDTWPDLVPNTTAEAVSPVSPDLSAV